MTSPMRLLCVCVCVVVYPLCLQGLKAMDSNGLADPYVKLHLLPGASKVTDSSLPLCQLTQCATSLSCLLTSKGSNCIAQTPMLKSGLSIPPLNRSANRNYSNLFFVVSMRNQQKIKTLLLLLAPLQN